MAAEIDFQPYLQSINSHYAQWWQLYTLTDAQTKAQQQNEPQPWKTPFDFGLMVQTVQRDRLGRRFWRAIAYYKRSPWIPFYDETAYVALRT